MKGVAVMKTPKGFFTYFHHEDVICALTDEEAGRLYKALIHYGTTGELPDFSSEPAAKIAFAVFRSEIDFNFEKYREVCEKRSEIAKIREAEKRARRLIEHI